MPLGFLRTVQPRRLFQPSAGGRPLTKMNEEVKSICSSELFLGAILGTLESGAEIENIAEAVRVVFAHQSGCESLLEMLQYPWPMLVDRLNHNEAEALAEEAISLPCLHEDVKRKITNGMEGWKCRMTQPGKDYRPKSTYVYLIKNHRNGFVKIGRSVNPSTREKTLQSEEPELEMIFHHKGLESDELFLHQKFNEKRLRGEWFKLDDEDVKFIVEHMSGGGK